MRSLASCRRVEAIRSQPVCFMSIPLIYLMSSSPMPREHRSIVFLFTSSLDVWDRSCSSLLANHRLFPTCCCLPGAPVGPRVSSIGSGCWPVSSQRQKMVDSVGDLFRPGFLVQQVGDHLTYRNLVLGDYDLARGFLEAFFGIIGSV